MNKFTSIRDVADWKSLLQLAAIAKAAPHQHASIGRNKTLGLLFFNPSLRTRMSTQRAAANLGMNVMVMNLNSDGWQIELNDGVVMDGSRQEHIREAAGVISQYCNIIGLRTFASLTSRSADYEESVLRQFIRYARVPVVSMESATRHPLQSLADLLTIQEHKQTNKPKVVLSWAPHPRALPQAVANSFVEWMKTADLDLSIANPKGFDLASEITESVPVYHSQEEAFEGADFVYAKNWSSYEDYGRVGKGLQHWCISPEQMARTNQAKFMHCLPVRRNVVVSDEVIDAADSLVLQQAENRIYATQAVLLKMIKNEK